MKKSLVRAAGLAASLTMTFKAFGWWDGSHLMITELATVANDSSYQNFMTSDARSAIDLLLQEPLEVPGSRALSSNTNSLPTAAIWADAIKLFPGQGENYKTCHYVDVPISTINVHVSHETALSKVKAYSAANQSNLNAISCLKSAIKTINTPSASSTARALALRLALHIISDIAQPLHNASLAGDMGGNNTVLQTPFKIGLNTGKTASAHNLHQLWDAGFGMYDQFPYSVEREKSGLYTPEELSYTTEQARILSERADYKNLPINARSEGVESLEEWVAGAYEVAQNYAYSNLTMTARDRSGKVHVSIVKDDAYHNAGKAPVATQLYIGAVHVAKLMTALFDPSQAEPGYLNMVKDITQDDSVRMLPY